MAKMAADAAQQRQVIEQVRATVDRVDQTSQQQALLANAADAAESMRQQVHELIAAVSVFRLTDGPPQAVRVAEPQTMRLAARRG
jgi:methyl-accepting chemotaxis protein